MESEALKNDWSSTSNLVHEGAGDGDISTDQSFYSAVSELDRTEMEEPENYKEEIHEVQSKINEKGDALSENSEVGVSSAVSSGTNEPTDEDQPEIGIETCPKKDQDGIKQKKKSKSSIGERIRKKLVKLVSKKKKTKNVNPTGDVDVEVETEPSSSECETGSRSADTDDLSDSEYLDACPRELPDGAASADWFEKLAEADKQLSILVGNPALYYSALNREFVVTNIVNWYARLAEFTLPTKFVKLSKAFIDYLGNDEVHLPKGMETSASSGINKDLSAKVGYTINEEWSEEEDENLNYDGGIEIIKEALSKEHVLVVGKEGSGESDDSEDGLIQSIQNMTFSKPVSTEKFDALNEWMAKTIKELGGRAFPKLNSKSPKDAAWIAYGRQLCCYLPGDIYLLLKCSNTISRMVEVMPEGIKLQDKSSDENPAKDTNEKGGGYYLVLREWIDISPDTEFRCFVHMGRLLAISQRDINCSYPYIEKERDSIIWDIYKFFAKINSLVGLQTYVFDVMRTPNKVTLIDLNPFCVDTDPCLFTYGDLDDIYKEMKNKEKPSDDEDFETGDAQKEKLPWTEKYGEPVLRFLDKRVANPYLSTGAKHDERMQLNQGN